ncbi:helix-turn-helix domain-containing protein [Micromonospora sp. NPDC047557]|uniref:helix-turn-helix domain-containing protein n=1 Tax=Micromonospora sp. NPDC047557 TaxID=3364250 RepID=UPI00371DF22F
MPDQQRPELGAVRRWGRGHGSSRRGVGAVTPTRPTGRDRCTSRLRDPRAGPPGPPPPPLPRHSFLPLGYDGSYPWGTTAFPAVGGAAAVKVALLASRDLRPNERLVLVAIAAHSNRDGDAWPSVATIAGYAGVSVRTVQQALAKLVQLGRLVVRRVANVATRVSAMILVAALALGTVGGPGGPPG